MSLLGYKRKPPSVSKFHLEVVVSHSLIVAMRPRLTDQDGAEPVNPG